MERSVDISNMTIPLLNTTLVYGIGVFVLYAVMPAVIVLFWSKKGKEAQAVTSMVPYIINAFVFVFAWLMFVTFISMVMILVLPAGEGNPAHGIDGFFHVDWLSPDVLKSISGVNASGSSKIFSNATVQEIISAKMMTVFMSLVKLLYHVLLILFYFFMFHFSYSLTSLKTKQANEEMGMGYAGNLAAAFVASTLAFYMIFWIESSMLTGLLNLASSAQRINKFQTGDLTVNMLDDFMEFVRLGIERWKTALSVKP